MLCYQCGTEVDDSATRCPNCGADLSKKVATRLDLKSSGLDRFTREVKPVHKGDKRLVEPRREIAGRFVVGDLIGRGPFGDVYRADDTEIDTEVALKVYRPALLKDPRVHERFLEVTKEARVLTQKNVLRVHESGVAGELGWVSMEILEGLTLERVLALRASKGEGFALEELEPFVQQVTSALQHISRLHPHGNLKPSNIFFLPELVKVTDYYIADALGDALTAEALSESPYVPPELRGGDNAPDERADVYSLGMILSEMAFGQREVPEDVPREKAALAKLCRKAMHVDKTRRYPHVEALSEDFITAVDTGSLLVASPPPMPPTATGEAKAPPPPPGAPPAAEEDELETIKVARDHERALVSGVAVTRDGGEDMRRTNELGSIKPSADLDADATTEVETRTHDRVKTAVALQPSAKKAPPKNNERDPGGLNVPVIVVLVLIIGGLIAFIAYSNSQGSRDDGEVVKIGGDTATTQAKAATTTASADTAAGEEGLGKAIDQARGALVSASTAAASSASSKAAAPDDGKVTPVAVASPAPPPKSTGGGSGGGRKSTSSTGSAGAKSKDTGARVASDGACKSGMVKIKGKGGAYCIDRYEYPNVRGSKPKTKVSWFDARKRCEAQGKRLCTITEWRRACGGRYPYGSKFDPDRCNTQDEDEFERALASAGKFKRCKSRSGAFDMSGNAHEWVAERKVAGGGYESDATVSSCRYASSKSPSSTAAYIGFRCCGNPQ